MTTLVQTEDTCHGKLRFKGTRIRLVDALDAIDYRDLDRLIEDYHLTSEQIAEAAEIWLSIRSRLDKESDEKYRA